MISLRTDLGRDRDNKESEKNSGADRVTKIQGHRQSVPAGFTQSRRANLYDPEREGDLRNFVKDTEEVGVTSMHDLVLAAFNVGGTWKWSKHVNLLYTVRRDIIGDTTAMAYIGLQFLTR